jgi:hypothetical protein
VFLLNPPSHDAKSGCKGTKKSEKRKMKDEKIYEFECFLCNEGQPDDK